MKPGSGLYDRFEAPARWIKIFLQMMTGIVLVILILLQYIHTFFSLSSLPVHFDFLNFNFLDSFLQTIYPIPTLKLVGYALIFSTAIELAFALFTDDLDEAVTPLITGLSATIVIFISDPNLKIDINVATGIAIAVLALAGLFAIKKFLLK